MPVYIQRFDGEWVDVSGGSFLRVCCDCGLVHREEYRIVKSDNGDRIIRQLIRDNRATSAQRRSLKARKEGLWSKKMAKYGAKTGAGRGTGMSGGGGRNRNTGGCSKGGPGHAKGGGRGRGTGRKS